MNHVIYTVGAAALVAALGCQAEASAQAPIAGRAEATQVSAHGLLASAPFAAAPVKGVYFFAGDVAAYNQNLYTAHPTRAEDTRWNTDAAARADVIDRLIATHANTLVMSYWGDDMTQWSPMQLDTTSISHVVEAVAGKPLVIMPALESGADPQNPLTPHWSFAEDFPYPGGLIAPSNLAPGLIARIHDLVALFRDQPESWARMYDRTGKPRYAIHILHACSRQVPTVPGVTPDQLIAQSFDAVAAEIARSEGIDIGFTLDVVPAEANGFTYTPQGSGSAFAAADSILAIQGFISEIYTNTIRNGAPNQAPRDNNLDNLPSIVRAKAARLDAWTQTEIPVLLDVSSGFDGRIVWKAQGTAFWGDNLDYTSDEWRNALSALKGGDYAGITFNTWNGFTEGYAAVPTVEHGNVVSDWLTDLYAPDPRTCAHTEYTDGRRSYRVTGSICEKWRAAGARYGILGAPIADETSTTRARASRFEHGVVFASDTLGVHEVHGAIAELYERMGYETSCLGLPVSDEQSGPNGLVSHFEAGDITFVDGQARSSCS